MRGSGWGFATKANSSACGGENGGWSAEASSETHSRTLVEVTSGPQNRTEHVLDVDRLLIHETEERVANHRSTLLIAVSYSKP